MALKAMFSRYGIPQTPISDNGPQYTFEEFAKSVSSYRFIHLSSSPYFPQSKGSERAVKAVKNLLKDSDDFICPY